MNPKKAENLATAYYIAYLEEETRKTGDRFYSDAANVIRKLKEQLANAQDALAEHSYGGTT